MTTSKARAMAVCLSEKNERASQPIAGHVPAMGRMKRSKLFGYERPGKRLASLSSRSPVPKAHVKGSDLSGNRITWKGKDRLRQTEHPNAMPTTERFPGSPGMVRKARVLKESEVKTSVEMRLAARCQSAEKCLGRDAGIVLRPNLAEQPSPAKECRVPGWSAP